MDIIIDKLLNILASIVAISALLFILPPFLFFKFVRYVLRSMFKEDVAGKVVIITGASSGIGEHLAYEYARRGARLVLAARRKNRLHEVAERASWIGSPDAIPIVADVSKVEDCKRLIEETVHRFGQYHLVNNASVAPLSLFEDFDDVTKAAPAMDINFWGSVYTTYFAIPYLRETNGKIVVVASSASWLHAPRLSFYNASKAAVVSFYETLRVEIGSDIGITIVTPGLIESEMTKGKFLSKEGEMQVDQEMRDVAMSVIPVRSVDECAKAIVNGACRGDEYLTDPYWVRATFFYKVFCPEVIEWLNRWLAFSGPGMSPREAPSKKILDASGLREYLHPDSIQFPELKMD